MRHKIPAGVALALAALLIPAPAMAQAGPLSLTTAVTCPAVVVYKDVRTLITIDLDTATDTEVRVLAAQILTVANANPLPVLRGALQTQLNGTPDQLRAFLKGSVQNAWKTDLRIAIARTLTTAGPYVQAAAQATLDAPGIDAYLAYLNDGLFVARARDCVI